MDIDIRHNEPARRFEARVEGHLCHTDYRRQGDVMVMPHTSVPPPVGGRGIAERLVRAALAYAREHGLRVDARCEFVQAYMERHPDVQSLRV